MKSGINFFTENISYRIPGKQILRRWVVVCIEREGQIAGDINFILCDDELLSELNYKYLRHKTLTDILTFPVDDEESNISGDIYISLPRVRENAIKFNQNTRDELRRVMIHGILHLTGHHDSTPNEKLDMRKREDDYLEVFHSMMKATPLG